MASSFVTKDALSRMIIPALHREIVLPATVNRQPESDYGGGTGTTVTVRNAARRASTSRTVGATAPITSTDSTQAATDVVLTDDVYDAQDVTDASFTLDLVSFTEEVMIPSMQAVARGIEDVLIGVMSGATYPVSNQLTLALGASAYDTVVAARKALTSQEVPTSDLWMACGSDFYARLLEERLLAGVDQSGNESALRSAMIGRVGGFNLVEAVGLPADEAIAYHRTAFNMPVVAPVVPQGASFGDSVAQDGLALQYVRDYDASTLQDRLIFRAFTGAAVTLDPPKDNPAGTRALYRAAKITVAAV